jgi:hypothetical protein
MVMMAGDETSAAWTVPVVGPMVNMLTDVTIIANAKIATARDLVT